MSKRKDINYKLARENLYNKDLFLNNYIDDMLTKCNHLFHAKCLERWIECKSKCPNCRREITIE